MNLKRLAVLAVAAACALAACSNPATPKGDYGSLSGTVTSSTGSPIAGAVITIDFTIKVTTAADGSYKASTVPADAPGTTGSTNVSVQASGYLTPSPQIVTVQAGQNTVVNFQLTHT